MVRTIIPPLTPTVLTPTLMTLERREEAESWDRGVGGSVSVSWPRSSTMLSPLSITTLLTRLITSPSPSPPSPAQKED